jgi:hypothetical protein
VVSTKWSLPEWRADGELGAEREIIFDYDLVERRGKFFSRDEEDSPLFLGTLAAIVRDGPPLKWAVRVNGILTFKDCP